MREPLRKLPPSLKMAWAKYEGEDLNRVSLESFRYWYVKQTKTWEYAFQEAPGAHDSRPSIKSQYQRDAQSMEAKPCPFHEKARHPLEQ